MKKFFILSAGMFLGSAILVENIECLSAFTTAIKNKLNKSATGRALISAGSAIGTVGKEVATTTAIQYASDNIIPQARQNLQTLFAQLATCKTQLINTLSQYGQNLILAAGTAASSITAYITKINNIINTMNTLSAQLATITTNMNTLLVQINNLQVQMTQTTDSANLSSLQTQLASLQNQYDKLQTQYNTIQSQQTDMNTQLNTNLASLQTQVNNTNNVNLSNAHTTYTNTITIYLIVIAAWDDATLLTNNLAIISRNIQNGMYPTTAALQAALQQFNIKTLAQSLRDKLVQLAQLAQFAQLAQLAQLAETVYNNVINLENFDSVGAAAVNIGTNALITKMQQATTTQQTTGAATLVLHN